MWCTARFNPWPSFIFDICQRYEDILYADDSALLASSSDVSETEEILKRELESVRVS